MRAVYKTDKEENFSFTEPYVFSLKRLWESILLNLRIFSYLLMWCLIPIGGFIVLGILESVLPDGTSDLIVGLGTFLMIIAFFVIYITKFFQLAFAFSLLFSSETMTNGEAFRGSIALSKGITPRIFVNYLILGLIMGMIGGMYGLIALNPMTPSSSLQELTQKYQQDMSAPVTSMRDDAEEGDGAFELSREDRQDREKLREEFTKAFFEEYSKESFSPLRTLLTLPLTVIAGCFWVAFNFAFTKKAIEERGSLIGKSSI